MHLIKTKLNGIIRRMRCYSYGITYGRSGSFKIPEKLKINGKFLRFKFFNKKAPWFMYEFSEICIEDCYSLQKIKKQLKERIEKIVDIGANQGLFALAARQHFPKATISCYEPNYRLKGFLDDNIEALNATCYYEAVTSRDCRVALNFTDNDLETTSVVSENGNVQGTAFSKVIERCGGYIDILKMDCEGAEWDLFEEIDCWKRVKSLTMEYHLWAKEGSTESCVKNILTKLGFHILSHSPLSDKFGLITAIKSATEQ